tara:strand:+ start:82 stop:576 length:495 start_codon:yes stop_codon:yes gene_type:complete
MKKLLLENKDCSEHNVNLYEDLEKVCYEKTSSSYKYVVRECYAQGNLGCPQDYVYARRFEIDIMELDGGTYSKWCGQLDDTQSMAPGAPIKKRRDRVEVLQLHTFYQSITDKDKPHYLCPTKYGHSFCSSKFISVEYAIDLINEHIEWTKTTEYKELMESRRAA